MAQQQQQHKPKQTALTLLLPNTPGNTQIPSQHPTYMYSITTLQNPPTVALRGEGAAEAALGLGSGWFWDLGAA